MWDRFKYGWCSEYEGQGCLQGCTGEICARRRKAEGAGGGGNGSGAPYASTGTTAGCGGGGGMQIESGPLRVLASAEGWRIESRPFEQVGQTPDDSLQANQLAALAAATALLDVMRDALRDVADKAKGDLVVNVSVRLDSGQDGPTAGVRLKGR